MKEFCKYCNFLPSDKICLSFKNICLLCSAKNAPYGLTVGGVFIIDLPDREQVSACADYCSKYQVSTLANHSSWMG